MKRTKNRTKKIRRLQRALSGILRYAIDLDDTLKETMRELRRHHNGLFPHKPDLLFSQYTTLDLARLWGITTREASQLCFDFHRTVLTGIPCMPGAEDAVRRLAAEKDLLLITARRNALAELTLEEVGKDFAGHFMGVEICNHYALDDTPMRRKVDVCILCGCGLIIDDSATTAAECNAAGIWVILVDQPWNRDFKDDECEFVIRVPANWARILKILLVP